VNQQIVVPAANPRMASSGNCGIRRKW